MENVKENFFLFVANHMVSSPFYRVVAVFSCRTALFLAFMKKGVKEVRMNISSSSTSDVSYVADITLDVSALKNTMFLPGSERCCARGEWRCTWNTDSLGALHSDARRRKDTKQAAEGKAPCSHTVGTDYGEFICLLTIAGLAMLKMF